MDSNKNTASKNLFTIVLAVLALIVAIVSSNDSARQFFSSAVSTRKILAKVFTEYTDKKFVIFKVKTESGINIEIFEKDALGAQKLKQVFSLPKDAEAFLMVGSNSMNLGLKDIDQDGQQEILAPTVDRNGNSRLNILKYNPELDQFVAATEDLL